MTWTSLGEGHYSDYCIIQDFDHNKGFVGKRKGENGYWNGIQKCLPHSPNIILTHAAPFFPHRKADGDGLMGELA